MHSAIRYFLPNTRPMALIPDGPSASLANSLGIPNPMRIPCVGDAGQKFSELLTAMNWRTDLAILDLSVTPADPVPSLAQMKTASLIHGLFHFLSVRGEMILLLKAEDERALFGNLLIPDFRRDHSAPCDRLSLSVWLRLVEDDRVALFIARQHKSDAPHRIDAAKSTVEQLIEAGRRRPVRISCGTVFDICDLHPDSAKGFQAALTEWHRRGGLDTGDTHPYNLWLAGGTVKVWLNSWQERVTNLDHHGLKALAGFSVGALSMSGSPPAILRAALGDPRLKVAPELRAAIDEAEQAGSRMRAPFYTLTPAQRLGWLVEHQGITCKETFGQFKKGQSYKLNCVVSEFTRAATRQNLFGKDENVSLHARDMIFEIQTAKGIWHRFADWTGRSLKGGVNYFTLHDQETRHSLVALCDHFEIPEVADVAALHPKRYQRALDILDDIERQANGGFHWRQFQRDDLARFSLQPGGIFAWDKGGGKGLALYAISILYGARRTLLVAPEGLHDQICAEWQEKFGFAPRRIMTLADIDADPKLKAAIMATINGTAEPPSHEAAAVRGDFWLTSYTALGYNGADEWPDDFDEQSGEKLVSKKLKKSREKDGVIPGLGDKGIGEETHYLIPHAAEPHTVRCVLTPSLATVLRDVFDCVECDESVRLKSTDSFVSLGVRRLRPAHPVALTGTPVKNRLEDIFWLAHWTCGSPTVGNSRFPFANTSSARERFADLFMVMEENHTRREKYRQMNPGKSRKFTRRLPQTTNVHALWRVLGNIVMRRRKSDFGEEIVPKTIMPVRVKPGRAQQAVYKFHLENPPTHNAKGEPMDEVAALLAQLNNLRQAALSPDSPNLRREEFPQSCSWTDHCPLLTGIFHLVEEKLGEGEQVMIASPFQYFSQSLEARLLEAGISCVRLDGDKSAEERGRLARQFKQRRFSILIAGQQAMGEGHSFEHCCNLILPALHWAFDVNSQVEDRVHRLPAGEAGEKRGNGEAEKRRVAGSPHRRLAGSSSVCDAIRGMPMATLAALHGSSTNIAQLEALRSQFLAYASATQHTDWRPAWSAFRALPAAHRERIAAARPIPQPQQQDLIEATLAELS